MSRENEKTLIRIAVCDDNMRLCSDIEKCIFDYRENSQEFYDVEIYYSGKTIIEDLKKGIHYDMFFLDIEIEFMNGVQVGRFIREKLQDDNTLIVYMSSYTKYAMKLFEVRPMDFLIKPLNEKKIIKALETGTKLLHKGEVSFQYKQGRNWNKIYIRNIIYFKAKDREVEMITQNGTITFYEALESIYEKLEPYKFFYAHKSYLVNYFHVSEFFYDKLLMSNGDEIGIAQTRRKAVRKIQKELLYKELSDDF